MNRITRFFLSLSLILAAPGLAPYRAAAQTISARVAAPAGPAAAAGASINALGAASAVLPSASLQAGLIPTLTPAPSLAPLPAAPAAAANAGTRWLATPATALKAPFIRAAAAAPAKAAVPAPAPAAALAALKTGGDALAVSAEASADAPRVALDGLFEGSIARPEALAVAGLSAPSDSPRLGTFVLPATITSFIFVALHETSDPVLFFTRFVHAIILSHVYHKEGILASMAAHGFFNGLLASSIVFSALGMPWLGIATVPVALIYAWFAAKSLRAQKSDRSSGALIPKPLGASLAFIMAAILVAGYFLIMPNIFWAIGAVALVVKGIMMLQAKKA